MIRKPLAGGGLNIIATWTRGYEYRLDLYCRHALDELDKATLEERLAATPAGELDHTAAVSSYQLGQKTCSGN